ncbi:MAG: hypothetical protein ACLQRH_25085, partial [Acidimicrobiales bacterium]
AGGMVDLGTLPGFKNSHATAVNASGHVVGWSSEPPPDPVQRREALDQVSAMVEAAIARFNEPISSSERLEGWNEVGSAYVVDFLIALSRDLETAKRDACPDLLPFEFRIHELLFDPNVPSYLDPNVPSPHSVNQRWKILLSIMSAC